MYDIDNVRLWKSGKDDHNISDEGNWENRKSNSAIPGSSTHID
jgi:hypothetical protein